MSLVAALPVFPGSHVLLFLMPSSPTSTNCAFYGPQRASESCCVDVGSGSERSAGFNINTLMFLLERPTCAHPQSLGDLVFCVWTQIIWTLCPTSEGRWPQDWFLHDEFWGWRCFSKAAIRSFCKNSLSSLIAAANRICINLGKWGKVFFCLIQHICSYKHWSKAEMWNMRDTREQARNRLEWKRSDLQSWNVQEIRKWKNKMHSSVFSFLFCSQDSTLEPFDLNFFLLWHIVVTDVFPHRSPAFALRDPDVELI